MFWNIYSTYKFWNIHFHQESSVCQLVTLRSGESYTKNLAKYSHKGNKCKKIHFNQMYSTLGQNSFLSKFYESLNLTTH